MIARMLFLVDVFLLPFSVMAQNLDYLSGYYLNHFQQNNLCNTNNLSMTDDERSLYLIRITGFDEENNLNFYGFCLALSHKNPKANFYGFFLNMSFGNLRRYEKYISLNGINISLIGGSTEGTINGFSLGTLFNSATQANGIMMGALVSSEHLNGIVLGGLMSYSQYANAIQMSAVFNTFCNFNGIGIAIINSSWSGFEELMNSKSNNYCNVNKMYGVIIGFYNAVDVKGLSLALVNNGNGWLQIGLLNIGDSVLQIGLVNLRSGGRMGIPIINVNF